MAPQFFAHSRPEYSSDTHRARARTGYLEQARPDVEAAILNYLDGCPDGTQMTLAVLNWLGRERLDEIAEVGGRTFDTLKKDIGLFVVLVAIDLFGPARVETLRHEQSGRNSTRMRTADWPDLEWVARYTPHRVRPEPQAPEAGDLVDHGGFRAHRYLDVNREERFFCFLLAHALLAHRQARQAFAAQVAAVVPGCELDPSALEIYVEAAVLRDFWNDLGDPAVYDADCASRRRVVLDALFEHVGAQCAVDDHDLFWTTPERAKLWSPGRWSEKAIRAAGLQVLLQLKWAFNAKPDFLLHSPGQVLLIEAKLESGVGRGGGYDQIAIQRLIGELMSSQVPAFAGARVQLTTLGVVGPEGLSWERVVQAVDVPGLDTFTRAGLRRAVEVGR